MQVVKGDLIRMALKGEFDVIAHGVNCYGVQRAGIAKKMNKHFKTEEYSLEKRYWGNPNKLGMIQFRRFRMVSDEPILLDRNSIIQDPESNTFYVINCYTQFKYSKQSPQIDYDALRLCMRKINMMFPKRRVGLPWIGCGLAGGDKEKVKKIFEEELTNVRLTIVEL